MKRFLEEGEKSLYQEGEDTGKKLTKEMESFVSDYNMMIRKIGDLSDSVDETYAKKLKTEISARETALKQIGRALDLLELKRHQGILENIIYKGIPARIEQVLLKLCP